MLFYEQTALWRRMHGSLALRRAKHSFQPLQALHALCLTDVALCMPPQDPAKYVRCLAPYLKVAPLTAGPRSADRDRRDAACLLCKLVRPLL